MRLSGKGSARARAVVVDSDRCSVFFVYEKGRGLLGRCEAEGSLPDVEPDEEDCFRKAYALSEVVFDQGCLGLPMVRTTSFLTSSWFLFETLHAVRVTEEMKSLFRALAILRRVNGEELGPGWVIGLCRIVQDAWVQWKQEMARSEEVRERRLLLAKLFEAEAQARHEAQDHVPYRRGCPVCIGAQGRQRSHWRSSFPDLHSVWILQGLLSRVSRMMWRQADEIKDMGIGICWLVLMRSLTSSVAL